jgi:hypothetical protein
LQQRAGSLDLNDLPFDLNDDAGVIASNYFTQLMDEAIDESPPKRPMSMSIKGKEILTLDHFLLQQMLLL